MAKAKSTKPSKTPAKNDPPRPVIQGAADSVMGTPMTPPTVKPLPKAGSSDIGTMKDDKHSEARPKGGTKRRK